MTKENHIRGVTLRNRNRQELHEIVPLSHPLVVYLEPTNICNFRCHMCPTGDDELIKQVGRPKGYMPFELWKKVIDDLAEFDEPAECSHLFKDGESLLHPKFPEMLKYMRDKHVAKRLWIKTNGSMLNPELNEQLIANGLDNIGISVEHISPEGYEKRSQVKWFDYEGLRANVLDLYQRRRNCKVYVKTISQDLTPEEIAKFYRDWDDRCDYIGVENYHGWSGSFKDFSMGYTSDTYDGDPLTQKIVCPWTLFAITVNWNGTVSVCPEDWSWSAIIGDVNKESLIDIWNGERLYEFRRMHLENRRNENKACNGCYFMTTLPDNVDAHRGEILEKLNANRR